MHSWAVAQMCRAQVAVCSAEGGDVSKGLEMCWLRERNGSDASHRQADLGCVIDFVHLILRTQSGLNWNPDIKEFFQQSQILPV